MAWQNWKVNFKFKKDFYSYWKEPSAWRQFLIQFNLININEIQNFRVNNFNFSWSWKWNKREFQMSILRFQFQWVWVRDPNSGSRILRSFNSENNIWVYCIGYEQLTIKKSLWTFINLFKCKFIIKQQFKIQLNFYPN